MTDREVVSFAYKQAGWYYVFAYRVNCKGGNVVVSHQ